MNPTDISAAVLKIAAIKKKRDSILAQLAAAEQDLMSLMDAAEKTKISVPEGSVTVCNGRRTVSVTDPALKAEIKLLQERGVRTGRAQENIGNRYLLIRNR